MKRNRVRRGLSSPRPGPGEDSIYVSTNRRLCLVSVIEWKPWCSLQVASSSSLWAVAPGTVAHCAHTPGPYQQVTRSVAVTLGQCLMSAHSTHAHICTFIVYSSVDSCVVPLLILGWGDNVTYPGFWVDDGGLSQKLRGDRYLPIFAH